MKIDQTNGTIQSQAVREKAISSTRKIDQSTKTGNVSDASQVDSAKAEISSRAREMARAKDIASQTPDMREQRIAELRERIAKGQYNVKPEDVADRMVREHLQTRDLG